MPEDRERGSPHCIIAGGGIGGLTAALFLARAGWRVTLCDREPELREVGAGIQVSPNATRALEAIHILKDLDDIAVEPARLVVRRGESAQTLVESRFGEPARKRFGAPFLAVHRGDLQQVLLRRVEESGMITLRLGLALHDLRESETEITAIFESAEGTREEITGDLLLGADGVWSRARKLAGLPGPSSYSGKTAWRTLIAREQAPLFAREADVNLWMGPDAHIVHYPVCGGRDINVVVIVNDDWREEGWNAPGNPEILASRLRNWSPKVRDLVAAAEHWKRWALVTRPSEHRWSRKRMTLLGDAAHPMVPFLAQGASQAIEDAAELARLLAPHPQGAQLTQALQAYDHARIRRTARIQREALRQGSIYHFDGIRARLRDMALQMLPVDALLSRYAWIYGYDPLKGA